METFFFIMRKINGFKIEVPMGDNAWPIALAYTALAPWICFFVYIGLTKAAQSLGVVPKGVLIAVLSYAVLFLSFAAFCYPIAVSRQKAENLWRESNEGRRLLLDTEISTLGNSDQVWFAMAIQQSPGNYFLKFEREYQRYLEKPDLYGFTEKKAKQLAELNSRLQKIKLQKLPSDFTGIEAHIKGDLEWNQLRELAKRIPRGQD